MHVIAAEYGRFVLIGVTANVRRDRRYVGAELSKRAMWEYRPVSLVHAQSPRRIERCAELGRRPSDGEPAFPRNRFRQSAAHTQPDRSADRLRAATYHEPVYGPSFVRCQEPKRSPILIADICRETNMNITKIVLAGIAAVSISSSGALAQQALTGTISRVDEASGT